jgi:hypothetical protein
MVEFLVESYVATAEQAELHTRRAREVAEVLTFEGTPVRFLRSIFVAEDETCFYLYESPSVDGVREAARRADLSFESVSEALTELGNEEPR